MKIVIMNNLYKPYGRGGAERIAEIEAEGMLKSGHEVAVISTSAMDGMKNDYGYRTYYLKSLFIKLSEVPFFIRMFWHVWDNFNFINLLKISRIINIEKPDLVITHNLKGLTFLVPALLKAKKIKHIHTLHDIQLLHPSGLMYYKKEETIDSIPAKIYQLINRNLFEPEFVISPSGWLLSEHKKRGYFRKSESRIIRNPNDFIRADLIKKEIILPRLLFVGQLEPHKGIDILIEALGGIKEEYELWLVGDGSLSEKIKKDDNPKIKMFGRLPHEKISGMMKDASLLIMPSVCYENYPTVIIEALSAGLPAIASDLGGTREILGEEMLFAPDKESLSTKIREVILKIKRGELKAPPPGSLSSEDYIKEVLSLKI